LRQVLEFRDGLRREVVAIVGGAVDNALKDRGSSSLNASPQLSREGSAVVQLHEPTNSYHGSSATTCTPSGEEEASNSNGPAPHTDCLSRLPVEALASAETLGCETLGCESRGRHGLDQAVARQPGDELPGACVLESGADGATHGLVRRASRGKSPVRPKAKVWGLEFLKESGCLHPTSGSKVAC